MEPNSPIREAETALPRLGRRAVGGLAIAAAVLVAAAAAVVTVNRQVVRGSPQALQARFTIMPPPLNTFNHLAIATDGRAIIYATGPLLHLRRLDAVQPQPLADTQGAYDPFFSPDGRWFGYFVGDELTKLRITGGPPQTLAPARRAWSPSGDIVFAAERGASISRVAETGGDPVIIRRADQRKGWAAIRWPHVLPDGRHFLYLVRSDDMEVQGIYMGDLTRRDASGDRRVVAADSNVFFGSGHIAFVRRGQLHAQRFDPSQGQTTGTAFPIAERVDQDPYDDGFALFALSGNGVLTYRGGVTPDRQLRSHVVLEVTTPTRGSDLMLLDLSSKTLTPYLATPFMEREAQFSPDGRFMAYSSSESRQREVYVEPIPRDGRRWQVSSDYGREPRWRGDGRELFYLGRDDQLAAVAVQTRAAGLTFERPTPLFKLRIRGSDVRYHYAVSRDGQRFLVNTVVEDVPGTPINVWVDWLAGVTKGTDD